MAGDRCPTQPEILPQLLALLPQGRAWGTNEGGPLPDSVLVRFWNSVASVFEFANQRMCALREEFFCATQVETNAEWLAEYGLPDACDPFPDLCTKVAALGGSRCEYFAEVAARAGWAIDCPDDETCGDQAGCAETGNATPGLGPTQAFLIVRVDLGESPAYVGPLGPLPQAGAFQAGEPLLCPPDFSALRCILERIIPAHVKLVLQTIPIPTYWMADTDVFLSTEEFRMLME